MVSAERDAAPGHPQGALEGLRGHFHGPDVDITRQVPSMARWATWSSQILSKVSGHGSLWDWLRGTVGAIKRRRLQSRERWPVHSAETPRQALVVVHVEETDHDASHTFEFGIQA
jgi:hypothetical protein